MNTNVVPMAVRTGREKLKSTAARGGCAAACSIACLACGSEAMAQTDSPSAAGEVTNAVQSPTNAPSAGTNVVQLGTNIVVGLDIKRNGILPDLGATVFNVSQEQIQVLPMGENAPLNDVMLRMPGMVQDSAVNGDLHLRGEHANIQYRINDVLLPEGISTFGLELDTRFVDSMRLITGALPAQYGWRTAGVIDIHTKNGALEPGGEVSMYGGSFDTIRPGFQYGGTDGKWTYFVDATYDHNDIGIENPTSSYDPIHDTTDQYKAFAYLSYLIDDTSRVSLIGSASYVNYEIPNTPSLPPGTSPGGVPWNTEMPGVPTFESADLNERQVEQGYYAVVAYQKSAGPLNYQIAGYGRISAVHFEPDPVGDLFFNGVASDVNRTMYSGGFQADASYDAGEKHTIRFGVALLDQSLDYRSTTTVFPVDAAGNPTGGAFPIADNSDLHALFLGTYVQDEWKFLPKWTVNYGARFDLYAASFDHENQPSPRVSLVYEPTEMTTMHAGYARYFTPPPLEAVPATTIQKFANTSNQSAVTEDDPVKCERADYFDLGINQKVAKGFQFGVDGYYKEAKNQLDDGLFGQTLILAAFNYEFGRIYGVEFTPSYVNGGFMTYANLAWSVAQGRNWVSSQFLFDPADLAYVHNHYIYLDHDQTVTGSFGASYQWKQSNGSTKVYVDALYGSGLRTDSVNQIGETVPNGGTVPAYYSVSIGGERDFRLGRKDHLIARLDVVNITDNTYQLRNGTGVGVNAAQYGMRLGFFGTLSYRF